MYLSITIVTLKKAQRVQGNSAEYYPSFMILCLLCELTGWDGNKDLLWIVVMIIVGRVLMMIRLQFD